MILRFKRSSSFIRLAKAAVALCLLTGATLSYAAPAPAGSSLDNTATATFVDSASGTNVTLTSNTVRTIVQTLEALTLTSNQTVVRAPGASVAIPHQLTNTGNATTTYVLNLAPVAGGAFALTGLSLVQDVNGNGVADSGEPVIANGGTVTLAPGAVANFLIIGTLPGSAPTGQLTQVKLTATSQLQSATASNTDTIGAGTGASVSLTKSANPTNPVPGGTIQYTLDARNNGSVAAGGVPVTVDGAPANLFLLRDAIPANTVLTSVTPSVGTTLYHRIGDAANTYVTTLPPVANIDGVAFGLPSLTTATPFIASFTVTVNSNASGSLSNTAFAAYTDQGGTFNLPSNPVLLPLPNLPPALNFYTNNQYTNLVSQTGLGAPLFVQLNASQCNLDPTALDTRPITLVSKLTGDTETYTAVETGPNTGIFRIQPNVATADANVKVVASGDGIMEVLRNDQVTASITGCGAAVVRSTILVDPSGVVFDSKSNVLVPGTQVTLIDVTGAGNGGNPGGPAKVLQADATTIAPSTVTTGADGSFVFPFVDPSTYKLLIVTPAGYAFPSKVAPNQLPPGRTIDASGSYGGNFLVTVAGPVTIDVPVDTAAVSGLFVEKVASKTTAEIGDFVDYTVTVHNTSTVALPNTKVNDNLPAGFAYLKGSARLNGLVLADPVGGAGPALSFAAGNLIAGAQATLTYRVRLGPAAQSGDGTNRAQAVSGLTQSNVASAKVKPDQNGVFSNRAYLFGKVYADCNNNGIQDEGEVGIPGITIFLEDGTNATTDGEGKYSLYGLLPRTHVAKVDATTLPQGAELESLGQRSGNDPATRFVDLKSAELHRADFAVGNCSAPLLEEIATRRGATAADGETTAAARALLTATPLVTSDVRTLPASGTLDARGIAGRSGLAQTPTGLTTATASALAGSPQMSASATDEVKNVGLPPLAEQLPNLDPKLGFMNLEDGAVLSMAQTTIRVKGPLASTLKLTVNGREIEARQIGEKSSLEKTGVQAWEYVAVNLNPGRNTLTVAAVDGFGNAREESTITVTAPGALAKLVFEMPDTIKADGRTPVSLTVRLFDRDGVPVTSRTPLTIESDKGQWLTVDLDPTTPGLQIFAEDGVATVKMVPPSEAGTGRLRATAGAIRAETKVTFLPDLRPMLAVGIIEGVINLHNLNPKSLVPTQSGDLFEQEIVNVSRSFNSGKTTAAARGALYLKGKIDGQTLLTLAYDSDKPSDQTLFRDIQPDQFYPVYGDSSVKGFDAQSVSRLYVRVDRGTSYALYGDYSTQSEDPARGLTQYNRALTGAKTRYENDTVRVDSFLANTSSVQVIDEIPANGTSGPFSLSKSGYTVNSDQVHILTRDRNQPAVIIKDVPMARFSDYEVDTTTGRILFKAPIPSVDENLNPLSIRITYEVDNGGNKFWVGGIDAKLKVTDNIAVGGVYIRDTNPADRQTIKGTNATMKLGEKGLLVGEIAQTDDDLLGVGRGKRFEYRQDDETLQARVYGGKTDANFNNPSALLSQGRSEYGAKVAYRLDDQNSVSVEGIRTEDGTTGGRREGILLQIAHTLPENIKIEAGVRHVDETETPATDLSAGTTPNRYNSIRGKITVPVPGLAAASMYGEYERAVNDGSQQTLAVGGNYTLPIGGKLYFRHEFISSLSGNYDLTTSQRLNSTVFGIDTDYMKDGHVFNEYRVGDSIDGRSAEAAVGLRNQWHIAEGVAITTTAESIRPMSGPVLDKSNAITGAIDYTADPNWKGSARAEWRNGTSQDSWLISTGVALKVDADWTALGKGLISDQTNNTLNGGGHRISRAQLGFAYRPVTTEAWNALVRVELKNDNDSTLGPGLAIDEIAQIFSTNVNYQASRDVLIAARYAAKRATDQSNGLTSSYTAQMLGGRVIWDVTARWDAGINLYLLTGDGFRSRQYAIGGEIGYLVADNLWVSGGYNVQGFRDKDLAGEDYTQRGPYLRLRYKFDENVFGPSSGKADAASEARASAKADASAAAPAQ